MGSIRGLRTRLCLKCTEVTPHRTLYARTSEDGKRKWVQLFWACTKCGSLNHVVLPRYTLARAGFVVSALATAVVDALEKGPKDLNELVASLRRSRTAKERHVLAADLRLAIELLRARGMVAEVGRDRTGEALEALRAGSAGSKHLGVCPAESKKTLVSLYAQKQERTSHRMRFVSAGVFCPHCEYSEVDL
jgi:hypothetical protein